MEHNSHLALLPLKPVRPLVIAGHSIPNYIIHQWCLNYNHSCNRTAASRPRHSTAAGCHTDYTPDSAGWSFGPPSTAAGLLLDSAIAGPDCYTAAGCLSYTGSPSIINHCSIAPARHQCLRDQWRYTVGWIRHCNPGFGPLPLLRLVCKSNANVIMFFEEFLN